MTAALRPAVAARAAGGAPAVDPAGPAGRSPAGAPAGGSAGSAGGGLAGSPPGREAVLRWYAHAARDLPWRRPGVSGWAVLVSEVMLQQTPVARVLPVWQEWLDRWPTPSACAAAPAGDAVRLWGRLGYPRRALRLHAAAAVVAAEHGDVVPADPAVLLGLPGVGAYTAAAVAAFAYGAAVPVVDVNVKRVLSRAAGGVDDPRPVTAADRRRADVLLGGDPRAAQVSVAWMELGALCCTARAPRCAGCPLHGGCSWQRAGAPPFGGPAPRPQPFAGTDRQVRGALLAVLRAASGPVPPDTLDAVWADPTQRARALAGLVADGLAVATTGGYCLPS